MRSAHHNLICVCAPASFGINEVCNGMAKKFRYVFLFIVFAFMTVLIVFLLWACVSDDDLAPHIKGVYVSTEKINGDIFEMSDVEESIWKIAAKHSKKPILSYVKYKMKDERSGEALYSFISSYDIDLFGYKYVMITDIHIDIGSKTVVAVHYEAGMEQVVEIVRDSKYIKFKDKKINDIYMDFVKNNNLDYDHVEIEFKNDMIIISGCDSCSNRITYNVIT